MKITQLKFLFVILLAAVLVISGCTQNPPANQVSDQEYDNMVEEKLNEVLGEQETEDVQEEDEETSEDSTSSESTTPLSGEPSDKLSTIYGLYDSKSTSYLDFNFIDTERTTGKVTGYIAKTVFGNHILKDGKIEWTFKEEKLGGPDLFTLCEKTKADDSGVSDLKENEAQLILIDSGDSTWSYTIFVNAMVDVDIESTPIDNPGCENYEPILSSSRPISIGISSKTSVTDVTNIADIFKETKETPGSDGYVNIITYDQNWELHFPNE